MGSVKELNSTGDNDPELFPEEYYKHYMYCDWCGSFNLEPWIVPENHLKLKKYEGRVNTLSMVSLISAFISGLFWIYSVVAGLVFTGQFLFEIDTSIWLALSLIVFYISIKTLDYFEKVQQVGVRCADCSQKYKNNGPFFTELDSNPKNFTMKDVPQPLYARYFIRR